MWNWNSEEQSVKTLLTNHFVATPVRNFHGSLGTSKNGACHGRDSPWRKETGTMRFNMEEILQATKNFSPSLKVGQGGFGTVYKGTLDDGTLIAVKRAKKVSGVPFLFFPFNVATCCRCENWNFDVLCRACMTTMWVWSSRVRSKYWDRLNTSIWSGSLVIWRTMMRESLLLNMCLMEHSESILMVVIFIPRFILMLWSCHGCAFVGYLAFIITSSSHDEWCLMALNF